MNYLILSGYDSLLTSDEVLIMDNNIVHRLSSDDKHIMIEDYCWFDKKKIRKLIKSHGLTPCIVVICEDGDIDVNIVSC